MTETELQALKYPIGRFERPVSFDPEVIYPLIEAISSFPVRLSALTDDLSDVQKNWLYRPHGWSIRQVVHHCADSHMNAFIRFKLSLTEDTPTIKPYKEALWAVLDDSTEVDIAYSVKLIQGLHHRWTKLLSGLNKEEWNRTYKHPEHGRILNLGNTIGLYAWHCHHHLAHITQALEGKGKYGSMS